MILIVGLGNPGKKFQKTRHNVGFRVVDELKLISTLANARVVDELRSRPRKGEQERAKALSSSSHFASACIIDELGFLKDKKIILAKPQTFMNLSGKAVKKLIENCKLEIRNLIVIHDDLDLPLGKIRIVKNRGAAGHKGVESIIKELKTKNFVRLRIGIQPKTGKPRNPEKFVLQKFNKNEEGLVKEAIKKTAEAIEFSLKVGLAKTMSRYNK